MSYSQNQPSFRQLRSVVAERTSPIAVWVGAGLSVDAGLPTWAGLRQALVAEGESKAAELEAADRERCALELAAIEKQRDPWVAIERLRELLGETSYLACVRTSLTSNVDAAIPPAYEQIWQLGAQAVFTLNLDDLAKRAHASVHAGRRGLISGDGRHAASLDGYTQRTNDLVASLHGMLENSKSWVLTRSDLRDLLKDPTYTEFIRRIIHGYTNIFLGMGADDVAVGGHLQELKKMGVEFSQCYWFSNRRDAETDAWAEASGMRLIRYNPDPGHSEVVGQFLADLIAARPEPEPEAVPIRPFIDDEPLLELEAEALPDPSEMVKRSPDEIRNLLNREATRLLSIGAPASRAEYEEFCARYEQAIYLAWFVSASPGANHLMGYHLESEIASGAFGRVFRAVDSQGCPVAVKLLRHEIRSKRELLDSFRRGVRSMEILSDRGVQSMVRYRAATEIPSLVVMDWVEGPNLAEAKQALALNDWPILLKVCADVARVIRDAHSIPERVLHRDLRPANVMLKNFWTDNGNFEVVVLDFDLSWHLGAESRSVQYSTALGYLAPEQRGLTSGSTRHSAVDVYGLGMTFWYMLTGRDPVPDQHMHSDFEAVVSEAASNLAQTDWASLASRFARLVCWMTKNEQNERPDLVRVLDELTALRAAAERLDSEIPLDLSVEELAARTEYFRGYSPSIDTNSYSAAGRRGIEATLTCDPRENAVRLDIRWARTGVEERRGLNKYAARAESGVRGRLEASGWTVRASSQRGQNLEIEAVRARPAPGDLDALAADLDSAVSLLRFD